MKKNRLQICPFVLFLVIILLALFTVSYAGSVSNEIPVFTSDPVSTAKAGLPYNYKIEVNYHDNNALEYYLLNFPEGMIIEKSTGLVSWIPTTSGKFDVTIEVIDKEKSISATQEFTIVVEKALLTSIKALPSTVMYLYMNESKPIQSVTAYYDNNTSKELDLSSCSYESDNPEIATVDINGTVTGITNIISIAASITVSYTEEHISKSDTVLVVVNPPFIVFEGMDQACAFWESDYYR